MPNTGLFLNVHPPRHKYLPFNLQFNLTSDKGEARLRVGGANPN